MSVGWYLYAFVDPADAGGLVLPPGIDRTPVQIVRDGAYAAVASEVDTAPFDLTLSDADLTEDGWLAHAVRTHDQVVHAVFNRAPVLPMRFGGLYATRAGLVGLLRTEHAWLVDAFGRIREATEWHVRITEDRLSSAEPGKATAGPVWPCRRRHDRSTSDELWTRMHADLAPHAVRSHQRPAAMGRAYLVRRESERAFIRAAAGLTRLVTGRRLRIEIVGPLPAYHFVDVDSHRFAGFATRSAVGRGRTGR
ncbi:GvpL/GvpF family gas vesicle protein [Hamadaea sp. NPDC051192]|uniref:GvpL/GvpF family gas vesicle protein n=1 Tax=Hamadaea sp. NPDC051192 TaxID=3154940 RepID=UPI003418E270